MTQRKRRKPILKRLRRRAVEFDFDGGRLTSDAGLLLFRQTDARLGLVDAVNEAIPDPRDPRYVVHEQREMLAQRIFALAAGYEDENDHQNLQRPGLDTSYPAGHSANAISGCGRDVSTETGPIECMSCEVSSSMLLH